MFFLVSQENSIKKELPHMNIQQFSSNDLQTLECKFVSCKADLDSIAATNLARDDLLRQFVDTIYAHKKIPALS